MSPIPNHCIECDKPMHICGHICNECKEKEDHTKICDGCGEADCNGACMAPVDEEPMTIAVMLILHILVFQIVIFVVNALNMQIYKKKKIVMIIIKICRRIDNG